MGKSLVHHYRNRHRAAQYSTPRALEYTIMLSSMRSACMQQQQASSLTAIPLSSGLSAHRIFTAQPAHVAQPKREEKRMR